MYTAGQRFGNTVEEICITRVTPDLDTESGIHVPRMEEARSSFEVLLTGKPTGKRLVGRPRRRCENIIIMDLKEIDVDSRNWV